MRLNKAAAMVCAAVVPLIFLFAQPCCANVVVLDFEGLADMAPVAHHYQSSGVVFSNAVILTAGSSLNEIDFPPHSGDCVAYDEQDPISALFGTPVDFAGAYFTYSCPLTLYAYDSGSNLIGSVFSAGSSNYGDHEFLSISNPGIKTLTISGLQSGGSFTMDDFEFSGNGPRNVPAPGALLLCIFGSSLVGYVSRRRLVQR